VRLADGSGVAIKQPRHPDKLVEAVRWSITEGNVLQAIGRARGVRRSETVHITLLGNTALPLSVAQVMDWEELQPNDLTVAAAEAALAGRALPLAPADLAAARPDLWGSETAAKRALSGAGHFERSTSLIRGTYKGSGPFKTQTPARYRKGLRGRWSQAWVPVEGGETALQAIVGELAAFQLVHPAAPAETAPEPRQPVGAPVEAHMVGTGRLFVMGETPPFDVPAPPPTADPPEPVLPLVAVVPPGISPEAAARLRLVVSRLEAVRPPRMWGDYTDVMRVEAWQVRCAAARARYPEDHLVEHHPRAWAGGG